MAQYFSPQNELPVFERPKQREAILNELKGALYEFLLAQNLARHYQVEGAFFASLSAPDHQQLDQYQRYLLEHDHGLYEALPQLAVQGAELLIEKLPAKLEAIELLGRQRAYDSTTVGETDLLLKWPSRPPLSLSVKLCKLNSYVNTKSAGAKSFLSKYFHHPQAQLRQESFNQKMGQRYYQLCQELAMSEEELSHLPGELPAELREQLQSYYFSLIEELYAHLRFFHQQNPQQFLWDLAPICGVGQNHLWQLICFHTSTKEQRYQLGQLLLLKGEDLRERLAQFDWVAPKGGHASFSLNFDDFQLQIRVKPMNTYASSSYKINCSLKFHLD